MSARFPPSVGVGEGGEGGRTGDKPRREGVTNMGHGGEGRFEGCSKVVVSRPSFVSKPSCEAPHSFPSPSPPFASPWRRCCGPSHPCSQLTTQRDLGWATPPAHSSTAGETGGCCCSCRRWAGASCRRRTGSCCTAPVGRGSTHSGRNMIDDVKPTSARWVGGNGGDRISCRDVKHPSLEVGAGTGTRGFRAERAGRLQGCHTVFRPTILFRYPSRAQSPPPPSPFCAPAAPLSTPSCTPPCPGRPRPDPASSAARLLRLLLFRASHTA